MVKGGWKGRKKWEKQTLPPESSDIKQKKCQWVQILKFRLGYNPISHAYENSNRGEGLRTHDEKKEVNRYVRSKNIIEKNNTGFNIITGESKAPINQAVP